MKLRGDAHGATRSFAESIQAETFWFVPSLCLPSLSDRELEFESQSMGLTAPIFLLIPVGITPPLIFFFDTQNFQDRRDLHRLYIISPVQTLSYVYEYVLPSFLYSASQSTSGSCAA
jgi:hypothetical protein